MNEQKARDHRTLALAVFVVLTVILLGGIERAEAQWTTNGNNINNTNTGNVGIGTTNPLYGLHIEKTNGSGGMGWAALFKETGKNGVLIGSRGSGNGIGTISGVLFDLSWVSDLSLNPAGGNVGIGTLAPGNTLELFGANPILKLNNGADSYQFGFNGFTSATGGHPVLYNTRFANANSTLRISGRGTGASLGGGSSLGGQLQLFGTDYVADSTNFGSSLSLNTFTGAPASGIPVGINFNSQSGGTGVLGAFSFSMNSAVAMTIGTTGNVGIGTTNPGELLHVRKDQNTNTSILLENQTAGSAANTRIMVKNGTGGINQIGIYSASTTPYGAVAASDSYLYSNSAGLNLMVDNLDGIIKFSTGGNSERLRIDKNGNVGIGTSNPGYKLDVNGEINATGLRINGTPISTGGTSPVSSVFGRTGAVVAATNDYTWSQINKSASSLADLTTRSAGDLTSGTLPDARFPTILPAVSGANLTTLNASNLASGTVAPARLGSGSADASTFLRGDNTWAAPSGSQWSTSGSSVYYNSGNVGLGTSSPGYKLHLVSGTDNTTSLLSLDTGVHGGTQFQVGGTTNNESYLNMNVYSGGAYTTRFSVNNHGHVLLQPGGNGNVGIGTAADPSAKLEVSGNVNVTGTGNINAAGTITGGNIVAKYQDVAEWVESSQTLPPGTVVVLDQTKSNQVVASSKAYDTRVAGVISVQPGIALGENGAGKVLVATTGRVKVRVDATQAAIQVGDLLVTGDKEGVAVKSIPIDIGGVQIHRPGTLIGKALEPLAKGHGEILVLLSLQ